MDPREGIAIGIALQTHVLKACPVHQQLYFDEEVDPGAAFGLADELVRNNRSYVDDFNHDSHALTNMLSATLASSPKICPDC